MRYLASTDGYKAVLRQYETRNEDRGALRMKTYQSVWLSTCGALAALGVCSGLLFLPAMALLGLFMASASAAGIMTYCVYCEGGIRPLETRDLRRVVATHAGAAGLGVAGIGAYWTYLGLLTWPALLLVLVTSPWAVRFILGQPVLQPRTPRGNASAAPGGPSSSLVCSPPARLLSNGELGVAWSASFISLQAAISTTAIANVVALRQAYLDEIERRNPPGFRAWLDSGARVASNPARYLAAGDHERHAD